MTLFGEALGGEWCMIVEVLQFLNKIHMNFTKKNMLKN
jgi:hypothetical protein